MFSPGCVLEWEVIKKDYSSYPIWSVIALKLEFDIKSKRNTKDYFLFMYKLSWIHVQLKVII